MAKICYIPRKFQAKGMAQIDQANDIIEEYAEQGYTLTLRQLYYQFIAQDLMPNNEKSYKNLGELLNAARLAGLIDWDSMVDRTRAVESNAHWRSVGSMIETCASAFAVDKWADQENRIEVWIEKDALVGIIEDVCTRNDVPYFSCRGYTSQSEMHSAAMRLLKHCEKGQTVTILHLGDHDPSGIDMTRDIKDRLSLFMAPEEIKVDRIALNMAQIKKYNPPPNWAKITDSRAADYIAVYGDKSWELDALKPQQMEKLIEGKIHKLRDDKKWDLAITEEIEGRETLSELAEEHS